MDDFKDDKTDDLVNRLTLRGSLNSALEVECLREIEFLNRKRGALTAEGTVMRKHLAALHIFTTGEDQRRDLIKFASWYPRTWNAIITDNPTSFDLPDTAEEKGR